MKRKTIALLMTLALAVSMLAGCGSKDAKDTGRERAARIAAGQRTTAQMQRTISLTQGKVQMQRTVQRKKMERPETEKRLRSA